MPPHVPLAVAQFRPRKGEYAQNLARLTPLFAQIDALEPRPAIVQLPETALTGYFVEGGVGELALPAGQLAADLNAAYLAAVPHGRPLDVVIGFYEVWRNALHNSAMYVTLGGEAPVIRHVHRKLFLPTYGVFDEERFVERGTELRAFDTSWGRAAMLVCEDAWHSITGFLAALDGAQVLFIMAAAPSRGVWPREDDVPGPASLERWERLARDMAGEHGVYVSVAHLIAAEGGKTFAGGSIVVGPRGDVTVRGPLWEEAVLTADLDLADLTRARADMPLLTDARMMLPHLTAALGRIERGDAVEQRFDAAPVAAKATDGRRAAKPTPPSSPWTVIRGPRGGDAGPPPLDIDTELVTEWLVSFIREELAQRGFKRGVVGLSGGVDSAVTAYLAALALGPENVIGINLPYRTSSPESAAHAKLVVDALGIEGRTLEISAAVDGYLANEPEADGMRRGNVMARTRMIALFDLSAKYCGLPLGTGNKTERLFGYFTWHADDSPPINPLGDLYKTQIWQLGEALGVPEIILKKPPTADLVHGQTDEADLGVSYAVADRILNWLLHGYKPAEIVGAGFSEADVKTVHRRLEATHWKRRMPTVAMVSATAIGESYLRPVDY